MLSSGSESATSQLCFSSIIQRQRQEDHCTRKASLLYVTSFTTRGHTVRLRNNKRVKSSPSYTREAIFNISNFWKIPLCLLILD